jgi:3D-(3,5/4)-trihydroxycyclohexane-1,2-dione acylhydrolase (decyclizing)
VAETQAGKGALAWDHPCAVGGIGVTGSSAANALAAETDVVLAVGTRLTDFTTASRSLFRNPVTKLIQLNVAPYDTAKHGSRSLVVLPSSCMPCCDTAPTACRMNPRRWSPMDCLRPP